MKKKLCQLLLLFILSVSIPVIFHADCYAESISNYISMNAGSTISKHRSLSGVGEEEELNDSITVHKCPGFYGGKTTFIIDIKNIKVKKSENSYIGILLDGQELLSKYNLTQGSSIHKEVKQEFTGSDFGEPDERYLNLTANNLVESFDYTITVKDSTLYATSMTMPKKQTVRLYEDVEIKYTKKPQAALTDGITWSSSNKKVATIKDGVATPKKIGKTTITAKLHNGKKYCCVLTVVKPSPFLDYDSYNLICGNSFKNKLNYAKKKVTWSSSNKKVATVSSKGVIKGKKAGTCYIKAKSNGKTYKCKVKVSYQKPSFYGELTYYDTRNNFFEVTIKNRGKGTMTIHSAKAYSEHAQFKAFDRKLYLPKNKDVTIKPGKTKVLRFKVKGGVTASESDNHEVNFYMTYSGKKYLTWVTSGRCSYKNGKKWILPYSDYSAYHDWLYSYLN